ncbi:IS66-like element accessory protein TnpA [Sphingomonas lenta]|uniref:Transposase n=1 Tax=Sphingomonas lenta TaxID=1141887 RepID=A0A2A2SBA9_9SPHN|nr:transposase [Sphingomonas lenta]PAX06311.1 IS66 family insertion sequence hypothetical protein [Sphingomonas lenta]
MSRVEIIARTERRRSYTDEQRAEVLAEAARPGAVVAQVARRYGIAESLIYDWRKRRRCAEPTAGEPLRIVPYGMVAELPSTIIETSSAKSAHILEPEPPSRAPAPHRPGSEAAGDRPDAARPEPERGGIQVDLPSGVRLTVDAQVSEKALARVFRALRHAP